MLAMLLLLIDSEEDQRKFEELYHRYKQLMFHVSRDYFHTESAPLLSQSVVNQYKCF